MRKRLKVLTVGCKANFADSASVVRLAVAEGFDIVGDAQPADVVVINSCTVTHRADRDSRSHAKRARRENPKATVILTGCYAQVSPREREKIPEVDQKFLFHGFRFEVLGRQHAQIVQLRVTPPAPREDVTSS